MIENPKVDPSSEGRLPLDGIKVLDLSRVLSGPWATMSLADLGADVWKIENVDGGDDTRAWTIPSYKGVGAYYLCANRGKQSLAIDIKNPEGLAIIIELAKKADIIVENFRVGTADRLGVGWEALSAINPRLIYCSISGYGRTGVDATRPGYDFVIQAESGLMAVTGECDREPMKVGVPVTDVVSGMTAAQSILAALFERERTGRGQFLDISLLDCAINLLVNVGSAYLNTGLDSLRFGNAHPNIVPYQIFQTSDGDFVLAVGNDRQFAALCRKVIYQPRLAEDPRFLTAGGRTANRDALVPELTAIFKTNTRDHWVSSCLTAGVPAGVVKSIPEVFAGPDREGHCLVQVLSHPYLGYVSMVRPAHGIANQRTKEFKAPPMLGQDTSSVLSDVLGYDARSIDRLLAAGAIGTFVPE